MFRRFEKKSRYGRLRVEALELRAMLAADLPLALTSPDTNGDGVVTSADARLIANYLNGDRAYDVTSPSVMAHMVRMSEPNLVHLDRWSQRMSITLSAAWQRGGLFSWAMGD